MVYGYAHVIYSAVYDILMLLCIDLKRMIRNRDAAKQSPSISDVIDATNIKDISPSTGTVFSVLYTYLFNIPGHEFLNFLSYFDA